MEVLDPKGNVIHGEYVFLYPGKNGLPVSIGNRPGVYCLFKNIEDLNILPKVLKERFAGKYPTRKAYTSDFIRDGILFQIDAIAYKNACG